MHVTQLMSNKYLRSYNFGANQINLDGLNTLCL